MSVSVSATDSENDPRRSKRVHKPITNLIENSIRCRCDMDNEQGEMIECEQCKTWQHTFCMGIVSLPDTVNYRCGICRPRAITVPKSQAVLHQKKLASAENTEKTSQRANRKRVFYDFDFESFANYLAKQVGEYDRPVVLNRFFEKYKAISGYEGSTMTLTFKCRAKMVSESHIMSQFDIGTRAKMFFLMSTPVTDDLLKEYSKSAEVLVDESSRIISFKSKSLSFGGPEVKSRWRKYKKSKPQSPRFQAATMVVKPQSLSNQESINEEEEEEEVVPLVHPAPSTPAYANSVTNTGYIHNADLVPALSNRTPTIRNSLNEFALMPLANSFLNNNYAQPVQTMGRNSILNGVSSILTSLTGMMESQARMMREMSYVIPRESSAPVEEYTSLRDFLEYIRMYIQNIDSVHLTELNHKILTKSRELIIQSKRIPISQLMIALESAVALATPSTEAPSSIKAVDFFKMLNLYAAGQNSRQLASFCENLKKRIESTDEDQMIQIEKVVTALDAAFGIVSK
uniref:PHD-type domain-containing protein n=1 Tax=Caenorhabditis tropicalis TaxID=1561998 RepID=A0A1I7TZ08_9PELO